jgi:flavin-dependent dehydrogenase
MQTLKIVIIGGGVGGLAAANTLIDEGLSPLIIEAGNYPAYKVCGEFVSPEALPVLRKWGINPTRKIDSIKFKNINNDSFTLRIKNPGGSLSRTDLEGALRKRVLDNGITLYEGVRVLNIEKFNNDYKIFLSNNEVIQTEKILISAGRFFSKNGKKPETKYVGYKAHFTGKKINSLIMHMHSDGYFGFLPLEDGTINVTLLQKRGKDHVLKAMNKHLENLSIWEPGWIKVEAPDFGIKDNPLEKNIYYLGDACASIPPITGLGVTLALLSGVVAGKTCLTLSSEKYQKLWIKNFKKPIKIGILIHKLSLYRLTLPLFFIINRLNNSLSHFFFTRTRVAQLYYV